MGLKNAIICLVANLLIVSCNQSNHGQQNDVKSDRKLLDPANLDTTINPGNDFYDYANGTWLKKNPIPASESEWGSFSVLAENNLNALHKILDSTASVKNPTAGSPTQKVGDFYRSGMDSVAINRAGITPLNGVLNRINNIKDAAGIIAEIALEQTQGVNPLFGFSVSPDDKDVTREICQFAQDGLGLPDRDYYFNTDAQSTKIREAYKQYIPQIFMLMGDDGMISKKEADDVYKLETSLAKASMTRVDQRDPYKLYNKFTVPAISKATPGLDWKLMFQRLGIAGQDTILVGMPMFFKQVGVELSSSPVIVWKEYLRFHIVNRMASYLSDTLNNVHFLFYGKVIYGQQEQRPRWKRVLRTVDASLGELLGQLYVDKYFKPEAKKRMLELVNNLQATYADRIQHLSWMSDSTKKKALKKLNAFVKKIGYPDKWRDYGSLNIVNNNFIENLMNASVFDYKYNLNKLGKPVDRTEWGMTPPTVNAYYNPGFNEIVFPAGILQYPFFDFDADDAVNYGGIGAVIGHEMTHGFDDQGRLYDDVGNLHNWWSPADDKNFTERAAVVIKQFNASTVLDTMHVNGKLTQGENLADLGGLNIAYEAFKKTPQGKSVEKIDGFTPDQRFFLSWAQVWRANTHPETVRLRLMTDGHSPDILRCNMPISNMEPWYLAFSIKPTGKLYRPDSTRASVW